MLRHRLPIALLLLVVGGCFPIELSVSKDGKILIPREEGFFIFDPANGETKRLAPAGEGKPVFARFAPDGKSALLVREVEGFNQVSLTPVTLADGAAGKEFTSKNTAYVLYSPDGAKVALSRAAEEKNKKLDQQVPEIFVTSLADGQGKVVVKDVGSMFRWFPDSKRILVFQINDKDKDNHYIGTLSAVEVDSGKVTPLSAAKVEQQSYLEIAPDGSKALFTALAADKPAADVAKTEASGASLFELDVAGSTVRKIDKKASYAIYSPDGKHVVLGTPADGFSMEGLKLEIGDAKLENFTAVAPNAFMPMMSMAGEGRTYPGWIGNDKIFYFVKKKTYGTKGEALALMVVGADGKGAKCVQPQIDVGVLKASE